VGDDRTGEVTDLLQQLIRNECVNDGHAGSGHEARSTDLLGAYLDGAGLDLQTFEPAPGRASLVARIEGTDPAAPSLMLMGHTDVVPVTAANWHRDPFAAELVNGEVWGRGATDMLNLTASMAVAFKHLAASGFRPGGTLVYLAVADEEALGTYGAGWLTENERDAVTVDYVITEGGGAVLPSPSGPKLSAAAAEKGTHWCKLRVKGSPSHASRPFRTDNALVKAADIVGRIAAYRPETRIGELWRRNVQAMDFDADLTAALTDPERLWETCQNLPGLNLARQAHACTHLTIAPTVVHGGTKTNIIPDAVEIELDIRTLPGQSTEEVLSVIDELVGPHRDSVEVEVSGCYSPATESSVDTPLWSAMEAAARRLRPDVKVVPTLMAGATDARFFRRMGATAYGFGLMSGRIPIDELAQMFHGDNERIDQESLLLSTQLWTELATEFLAS
jgi:acetylornithine deacetylase/succinyl-diaminopimelate desuccinylase-like protein